MKRLLPLWTVLMQNEAFSYFLLSFQPFIWWNDKYIILPHPQRIVGTTKIGFNHTNNVNILYCIIVLCIWHKIEPNNSLKVQKLNTKYFSPMWHQMDRWPCYSSFLKLKMKQWTLFASRPSSVKWKASKSEESTSTRNTKISKSFGHQLEFTDGKMFCLT